MPLHFGFAPKLVLPHKINPLPTPSGPIPVPYPLTSAQKSQILLNARWFLIRAYGSWSNPEALKLAAFDALAPFGLPAVQKNEAAAFLLSAVFFAAHQANIGGDENISAFQDVVLEKLRSLSDDWQTFDSQHTLNTQSKLLQNLSNVLQNISENEKSILGNLR